MVPAGFEDIVAKDVRDVCTPEEKSVLESNIRDWLNVLNGLKRDVEVQLIAQKARMTRRQSEMLSNGNSYAEWLEYKAGEETWRVGAIRFMVSVEERILSAKSLRASKNDKEVTA